MNKLISGICLTTVFCGSVLASTISIEPPTATVLLGSPVSLNVNVAGINDLYAFQFDIAFDPAVLSAASVTEGDLFSSVGVFFSPGFINNTAGTVTFIGDSLSSSGPGLGTDGALAQIVFSAIGSGTSSVTLANVILLDSGFNDIMATAFEATVTATTSSTAPEPSSLLMLVNAIPLLWFGRYLRRRRILLFEVMSLRK